MKEFRKILFTIFAVFLCALCLRYFHSENPINNIINDSKIQTSVNVEVPQNLKKAKVLNVIDGDTLYVQYNGKKEKIRFIGIDTPESVNPDESKNCKQGVIASKYTKSQIKEGQIVFLEFDEEKYDKYNRMLAYVWLKDKSDNIESDMINAKLLSVGYAKTLTIEPNIKYKSNFISIENNAKNNDIGFWKNREELKWK